LAALLIVFTATAAANRFVLLATAWITTAALGIALAAVAMFVLSDVVPDIDAVHGQHCTSPSPSGLPRG
jgi:hypothetical protein